MPSTLVETVGAANANTFATRTEANTYLGDRLNASAWTGASDADKDTALLEACRELTNLRCWKGRRVTTTQALAWPRDYVPDPDNPNNEGLLVSGYEDLEDPFTTVTYYATTIVPTRVKNAQIELALEFLRAGALDVAGQDPDAVIASQTVDVISTTFVSPSSRPTGLGRYPRVMALLVPLWEPAKTGINLIRV